MNPTDSELDEIKNTLDGYKETVVAGGELDEVENTLDIDIDWSNLVASAV